MPDEDLGLTNLGYDAEGFWRVWYPKCPSCRRFNIVVTCLVAAEHGSQEVAKVNALVHPSLFSGESILARVPEKLRNDYIEAVRSGPKGKAALCGRCLQIILREYAKVTPGTLDSEIREVLASGKLPPGLAKSVDAVRNIRNLAAHPIKDQLTGEIIEVDEMEAHWLAKVIEELFNFYFMVDPELDKKIADLNSKLRSAGKPPVRTS